jgi:hypothetical protein
MQKNKSIICMKTFFITLLVFAWNIVLSQTVTPETYSRIKFVYEQKSNFIIEDEKLYADTLLFKITFPELKFSQGISPIDSTRTIGFITIKNLSKEDKRTLEGNLYHSTHTIEGIYDVQKNKTKLIYTRGSKTLNEIYKKYFGGNFSPFSYNVVVDYNKSKIFTNYPSVNYSTSFDSELKKIVFANEDKSAGTYTFQTKKGFQTDRITLNKKHNNKITSDIVFSNNDFAVDKIVSLYNTTTLLSVIYEQ